MFKVPNTLSFKLTLWFTSTFIIILLTALFILYLMVNATLKVRLDDDLMDDVLEYRAVKQSLQDY